MRLLASALLACAAALPAAGQPVAGSPAAAQAPRAVPAPPLTALGTAPLPLAPGAAPLTLEAAERLLVEQNLVVVAALRGVDAARAQRLVASSLPPPTLSVGSNFVQFAEGSRGFVRGTRVFTPANNINLGLSVLIERGGKRELRTRLAELNIGVAEIQVLDALRTQVFQLRQAFLSALQARANLEVALGNRAALDRTESLLRRQLRDGAIPEGDLLRFQASRLPFEGDVTNNAQAYAAGVATVAALLATDPAAFQPGAGTLAAMGVRPAVPASLGPMPVPPPPVAQPPEAQVLTPAPASRRPRTANPAAAPTTVRTVLSPVAFDLRGRFDLVPELGIGRDELAAAVTSRADVVVAALQLNAADANRLLQEAARSRDITLSGSVGRSTLPQDLPSGRSTGLDVGSLSASIPIFTRRITEGNVGAATAQAAQAGALARNALLQARADFATAWATYEQARALLGLYTGGALDRAEEAYRSTEAAYLAGGRTLLEVLDALRTLNTTRLAANGARYAYLLSLAQLEQATGVSGLSPRL